MPRRKRAFIDRSRARTYEVVYRPLGDRTDGPDRVLRPVPRGNASAPGAAEAGDDGDSYAYHLSAELDVSYARDRDSFALGEFGFPEDGYDYGKHFKGIGGGGQPDVLFFGKNDGKSDASDRDAQKIDGKRKPSADPADAVAASRRKVLEEDERRKAAAMAEIQAQRQVDGALDEVLAALEDSSADEHSEEEDVAASEAPESDFASDTEGREAVSETDDGLGLCDDFVQRAKGPEDMPVPRAIKTPSSKADKNDRPERLLDVQFDRLMREYLEDENGDEDGDDCYGSDESPQIEARDGDCTDTETDSEELSYCGGAGELHSELLEKLAADVPQDMSRLDNDIEVAMNALITQYKRTTVEEAYCGPDGLRAPEAIAGVRRAAAMHCRDTEVTRGKAMPDISREPVTGPTSEICSAEEMLNSPHETALDEEEDNGGFGDSNQWDIVLDDRPAKNWDCETILSTYSNLDNHPSVIDDGPGGARPRVVRPRHRDPIIRLDPRTSAPVDHLPGSLLLPGAQRGNVAAIDYGTLGKANSANVLARSRTETADEKRARKGAAKVAARERRAEKSELKKAFAAENVKQENHATLIGKSKVAVRF
jgi:protein LTV1